jgi:tRNA A37 methylthiotransferase MiaB
LSLAKLIQKISVINGVRRIRLGSVEPSQIDDEFLEVASEDFFAKHLHIAIQHSHNNILEAMKRLNRFESDLALFEKLSALGFAIGTDYIVGFPGENDTIWSKAFENISKMPLTHIHPFIYSPRDGTLAADMSNSTKGDISKNRLHELNELIASKNQTFRKNIDRPLIVLRENSNSGFCQFYNKITFDEPEKTQQKWVKVTEYNVQGKNTFALKYEEIGENGK